MIFSPGEREITILFEYFQTKHKYFVQNSVIQLPLSLCIYVKTRAATHPSFFLHTISRYNGLHLDEHIKLSRQRHAFSSLSPDWKKIVASACVVVKNLWDSEKPCVKHKAPTRKESVFASVNLIFIGF